MKKLLPLLLLILIGCSEPEPIDIDTLNFRNDTYYPINSDEPYSGPVFLLYENGQPKQEGTVKRGKWDGPYKTYYDNGQIKQEGTYKDGKMDGLMTWWYKTGQKTTEKIYKDGEEISEKERINPRRWR